MAREVLCPMCGGLIEADDDEGLVRLAQEHTIDAHGYRVPPEHVLQAAEDSKTEERT